MSLYDDDIDTDKTAASGWASSIKMMQSQLAFKKATITAPKREQMKRSGGSKLPPVIDLKSRRDEEENLPPPLYAPDPGGRNVSSSFANDPEWRFNDEYDPMWPNDYEKVVKELREKRDKEDDEKRRIERDERERERDREKERRRRDRMEVVSGFSRRRDSDEEEEQHERPRRGVGAAIAPPPSLDDGASTPPPPPSAQTSGGAGKIGGANILGGIGGSIAAKIMAKYGFKEGQGLGKSEQGIVKALEVEKTSKRGGRIVHEREEELNMPPPIMPPPAARSLNDKAELNIADILKNPSKVAILQNMVGPGEVDNELEPEVREECNSKYGPVIKVVVYEIPDAAAEEAVRIFVEFQRMEAAIKAVIDLNGRFFGGRQVQAGFYDVELFKAYKLGEPVLS